MKNSQFKKNALAAVIAASLPFYASVSESATQTITGGDVSVGSRFFDTRAESGDTYLIQITGGTGTLAVVGNLIHKEGGNAVVAITGPANYTIDQSFGTFANAIEASGSTNGLSLSGNGSTAGHIDLGNSTISIIKVENGHAVYIDDEIRGTLNVIGTLEGNTAITAGTNGFLGAGAKIVLNDATLNTTAASNGKVIDFSGTSGATGLQLEIRGSSLINGIVDGNNDVASTDNITVTGSAYFKDTVRNINTITVDGSAEFAGDIINGGTVTVNSKKGALVATSDVTTFHGDVAADINVVGYANFANKNEQTVQDLTVQSTGTLQITVGDISSTPSITAGAINIEDGATISLIPDRDIYTTSQTSYTGWIIAGNTSSVLGTGVTSAGAKSILVKSTSFVDGGNSIDGTIVLNTPEEVATAIRGQEGAGASTEESTLRVLKTAANAGNTSQATKNVYSTIANITDIKKLAKLGTESKVNNANATQEANVFASTKVVQGITHRLNGLRDEDMGSGYSYGDGPSSQGVWLQFLDSNADQDKRHNDDGDEVLGFTGDMNGLTLGFESDMDNGEDKYVAGIAFTMANLDTNKKNSSDKSVIKNYQVSLYGFWERDNYFVDGVLNLGVSQHDRNRYLDGFINTPITAEFTSQHYGLQFIGGMTEEFEGLQVQPMVGFNYTLITTESYTEEDNNDTGFAMKVDNQKYQKIELGAGVELSKAFQVSKGELEPSLRFMAWHDFKGQQVETTTRYVIGGSDFTSKGADAVKNSFQLAANLAYRRSDNMTFTTGYERNQKSDYKSDSFYLRMKYDF